MGYFYVLDKLVQPIILGKTVSSHCKDGTMKGTANHTKPWLQDCSVIVVAPSSGYCTRSKDGQSSFGPHP
jgi:hypothetical protein